MENEKNYFHSKTHPLKDIVVLIPAFNPDNKLVILINELTELGVENIIVVDDGSKNECKNIFEIIRSFNQCDVLQHAVNLGKGRALKTGFNHFLNHYKGFTGVITVDADGQHKCGDIVKVAQALGDNQNSLILGTRNFKDKNIPFRSRFGNLMTAKLFNYFAGMNISDTQTGLRGIPYHNVLSMIKISGEKYEFEMNMLMECIQKRTDIKEIGIETIYIDENKSSHFNPITDSVRIYVVFLKFIFSSFASFFVDILSFIIFIKVFVILVPDYFILLSTIGSRVLSSAFNYTVNRKAVFYFKDNKKNTMMKYYLLCIIQMFVSALGVSFIYNQIHQYEVVIKMVVDSLLFLTSFRIQRDWVFKSKTSSNSLTWENFRQ
ncbi:dolichol-phosphate mannosyltransferase [Clostridium polyendosporum]|uniref:Dolichol-phosphate mannosyltransferase n=1 Tax=Clostridium polyendosporum TaxID=69208 RepID=A0A919RZW6_9CLOT|nr:glycosyltransferase [Clostridium polyendosporum]GIM29272.1 dolichol-phosphate mannosyltransferase [Clostridium polyendosporum]